MSEHFLQFIWKFQLFDHADLVCTSGESVKVLHAGSLNRDAGPDFFNARLEIDGQLWAGNIEVHQNTSDWLRHNHHNDKAYDSVVMHVVANHDDVEIFRSSGTPIKCAVLRFDKKLEIRYREMVNSSDWIPCEKYISDIDCFLIKQFLGRLLVERMGKKVDAIEHELKRTSKSWEDVFYIFLLRNFGFSINAVPFELLAKALPHQLVLKHRNNRLSIEALLFGQAGLLYNNVEDDEYVAALRDEYQFLATKYKLKGLDGSVWKFLRTRPQNFPTIRIAQLAGLLHQHPSMFSKVVNCSSADEFKALFSDIELSPYWENHFVFGKPTVSRQKHLGSSALNLLSINLFVPFVFAYGHLNDMYLLKEKALDMLDAIQPDKNSIIERWGQLGMPVKSAFYTQALLHLKKEYCDEKRCLSCPIGKKIVEGGVCMR
jgi:Protein of unknown function (DUF2851).